MLTPSVIRVIARAVLLTYALQIPIAGAQVVADPAARSGQKPIIDRTANGVPLVHIAPPSAGGVSQNQYKDFNVGKEGLILNNALGITNTELGGQIPGNLQLGTQPARIILNEVTGTGNSQLKGYIEVAGQRADIIVANPNGITCDGCGFLNTTRATLTTGTASLAAGGELAGLDVTRGEIRIGQGGLNASNIGQLDLLARGIVIEGEVWAQQLNAVLGANRVLYGTLKAQPLAGTGVAPRFVVDIAALGGMYAKQIYLVANEKGVGVNSAGRIAALESNLTLSADGDLRVADVYAKQTAELTSAGKITTTGTASGAQLSIRAGSTAENQGTIEATSVLLVDADRLVNSGVIAQRANDRDLTLAPRSSLQNDGILYSASNLQINAPTVQGAGGQLLAEGAIDVAATRVDVSAQKWLSGKAITLNASGDARLRGVTFDAQSQITTAVNGALDLGAAVMRASDSVALSGGSVDTTGATIAAGKQLSIASAGDLTAQGATLSGVQSVRVDAGAIQAASASLLSDGRLAVNATAGIIATDAVLAAKQGVDVKAARVSGGAYIAQAGDANLSGAERIELAGGGVLAGARATLAADALSTAGAVIQAQDVVAESRTAALDNRGGAIVSTGTTTLRGAGIDNRTGSIQGEGTIVLDARDGAIANSGGAVVANGRLQITAAALSNQGGSIDTRDDLHLGMSTDNRGGLIRSAGALTLDAAGAQLDNRGGVLLANNTLSVLTSRTDNAGGLIRSQLGSVRLDSGALTSDAASGIAGTIAAAGDLSMRADQLSAQGGQIVAGGALTLRIEGDAKLDGAQVLAAGGNLLGSVGGVLSAQGAQLAAANDATFDSTRVTGGRYSAGGSLQITSRDALDVSDGALIAGVSLTARAANGIQTRNARVGAQQILMDAGVGALDNSAGVIVADAASAAALQLRGAGIANQGGVIASGGTLVADAGAENLDNRSGKITAGGALDVRSGALSGANGVLAAGGDMAVSSGALDNVGAVLSAGGTLSLDTHGQALSNNRGQVLSGKDLVLATGRLDNTAGRMAAAGALSLSANALNSAGGRIDAGTNAAVMVRGAIDLSGAAVSTHGDLSVKADALTTAGATLVADGALSVTSLALDNRSGVWSAGKALTLASGDTDNTGGRLLAGEALSIHSGAFTNDAGVLSAKDMLSLDAGANAVSSRGGAMVAKTGISVAGASLVADANQFDAGQGVALNIGTGRVSLDGAAIRAADGEVLIQGGALSARATRIDTPRDVQINASGAADASGARLAAGGALGIDVTGALLADDASVLAHRGVTLAGASVSANRATVASDSELSVRASTGAVQVAAAALQSGGPLAVQTTGSLDAHGATFESGRDLTVSAGETRAQDAAVRAAGALSLTTGALAADRATLASGGVFKLDAGAAALSLNASNLQSGAEMTLRAGSTVASGSTLTSGASLDLATAALSADHTTLLAVGGALQVHSADANLASARLASSGDTDLTTGVLDAAALRTSANGTLRMTANDIRASGAAANAQGNLIVRSAGAASFDGGALKSAGAIDIQAAGDAGAATLIAGGSVAVVAGGAGYFAGAQIGAGTTLGLAAQGLDTNGGKLTGRDITLNAGSGRYDNHAGAILADGSLGVVAGDFNNANADVRATTGISVVTASLNNRGGKLTTAGALAITTGIGGVDNSGGTLLSGSDLTLSAAAGVVNDGGTVATAGNATIAGAGAISNRSGLVQANAALNLGAQGIDNQAGTFSAGTALTLSAGTGTLDNTGGVIVSGGRTSLDAAQLGNHNGQIAAVGALSLNGGSAAFDNRAGVIRSSADLISIRTGAIDNTSAGRIAAAGALTIAASGGIDNRGGSLESGALTSISASGSLDNTTGVIVANSDLALTGQGIANANGSILVGGRLVANAGSGAVDNHGGVMSAQSSLSLTAGGALDNQNGRIGSNAALLLDTAAANNTNGLISAGTDATLATQGLSNVGGQILAGRDLAIDARGGSLDARSGVLAATRALALTGATLDVSGLSLGVGGDLSLSGGAINAASAQLQSNANLAVNSSGALDLSSAQVRANGSATLTGGSVTANALDIAANGALRVSGSGLALNDARLVSGNDVTLNASGLFSARNTTVVAAGDLLAHGGSADLAAAQLSAGGNLDLGVTAALDLSSGGTTLATGKDLTLRANGLSVAGRSFDVRHLILDAGAGALIATSSTLLASGDASLLGVGIDSQSAQVGVGGNLSVDAGAGVLDNRSGQLASVGALVVNAAALRNDGGVIGSQSDAASITVAGSLSNVGGRIVSNGVTSVRAVGLDNSNGLIAGNAIDVSAGTGTLTNVSGVLSGFDRAAVAAGAVNNDTGVIEAGASGLSLVAGTLSNQNSGVDRGIVTTGDATVSVAASLDNSYGYIGASRSLTLSAGSIGNGAGTLSGTTALSLSTGTLDNRGGTIQSAGNVTVTASSLDNRSNGLVFAGNTLAASITQIDNRDTRTGSYDRGLLAGGDITLTGTTLDNRNGAVVAGAALAINASGDIDNSGGQFAGDRVTLAAARFTNTSGRVDAQRSLATHFASFTADGAMASNGSVSIELSSDYTNTGTVAANGTLSITTSGTYTNAGKLSATDTFTLAALNLNNQASGQIVGANTWLNVSGTLNNDGVINASAGTTQINAGTLNNTGSIFGDTVGLTGGAVNNNANAVIAARAGLDARLTTLTNRDSALIYAAGDATISADTITNSSATIQAGNALTLSGNVTNTTPYRKTISTSSTSGPIVEFVQTQDGVPQAPRGNGVADVSWATSVAEASLSGFASPIPTAQGAPMLYAARPAGDPAAVYIITGADTNYRVLHPDTFGTSQPYAPVTSNICNVTGGSGASCFVQKNYTSSTAPWAVMGVTPPAFAEPASSCKTWNYSGSMPICTQTDPNWDAWQTAWGQLDTAIKAHNDVVATQNAVVSFEDYLRYSYTRSTSTTGDVGDRPAYLLAGGDLVVSGALTNDRSTVSAGGRVIASVSANIGSTVTATSSNDGSLVDSRVVASGWFGGHTRQDVTSPYHESTGAVSVPYVDFALVESAASSAPSVGSGPAPVTAGTASVPVVGTRFGDARGAGSAASVSAGAGAGGGSAGGTTPVVVGSVPLTPPGVAAPARVAPGSTAPTGADPSAIVAGGTVDLARVGITGAPGTVSVSGPSLGTLGSIPASPLPGSIIAAGARATQVAYLDAVRTGVSKAFADRATRVDQAGVTALADAVAHSGIGVKLVLGTPDGARGALERGRALDGSSILTGRGRISAPDNKLFTIHTEPGFGYLVETDPRFTNYKQFISSQYFIDRLEIDPASSLKRYGDGFAEQRLIEQEVRALTGRQLLAGYTDTQAQYLDLMNAGIAFAQQYQFSPGVALSAEQMARLTTDIVWIEAAVVDTAQGPQTVLVPRVYLHAPREGDVLPTGGLIAGGDVIIRNNAGDALANSGTIAGNRISIDAASLANRSGTISAADSLAILTAGELENSGGRISAGGNLDLLAGGKLVVRSEAITLPDGNRFVDRVGTIHAGGDLTAYAGQTLTLSGAQLDAQGRVLLAAAGDITLDTLASKSGYRAGTANGGDISEAHYGQNGTRINGAQDVALIAGLNADGTRTGTGDLHAIGADIKAGGTLALDARAIDIQAAVARDESGYNAIGIRGYAKQQISDERAVGGTLESSGDLTLSARAGDLTLTGVSARSASGTLGVSANGTLTFDALTLHARDQADSAQSSRSLLSSKQQTLRSDAQAEHAYASALAGAAVVLDSGQDLASRGTTVVAEGDLTARAGGKLTVGVAQERRDQTQNESRTKSGLLTGGASVTLGSRAQTLNQATSQTQEVGSAWVSSQGDIALQSGDRLMVQGSRVQASEGSTSLSGRSVLIDASANDRHSESEARTRSSGLTLAFESPVLSALQTMQQMGQAAGESNDLHTRILAGAAGALAGANAVSAVKADPKSGGGFTVSLTVGSSSSVSRQTQDSHEVVAGAVSAGRDLTVTAQGAGKDSTIEVSGSDLTAGRNATLSAEGAIKLASTQSTQSEHSTQHSSSAAVGVAVTYGQNGFAFGITARASGARGHADGADVAQRDTQVTAGETLTLKSGGDTTLAGAQARGETIIAKVGGDLNIESRQDTSRYKSLDQNASGSVTVGYGFSGSASAGQQKIDADYASVQRQSGLMAGDGGFDVTVGGNTALTGAVISSSQAAIDAGRNQLTTASLTSREIENHAEYSASSISLSGGFSRGPGTSTKDGTTPPGSEPKAGSTQPGLFGAPTSVYGPGSNIGVPGAMAANDEDRSTTTSGLSQGRLTLTGSGTKVPANLDHGVTTDTANPAALGNNFDAENIRQGFAVTGAFTQQLGTFTANRAAEADAIKAARDKLPPGSDAWKAADAQYQDAARWAPGGDYGRVATVLVAAASGNVTAGTTALVQNAAVGYLQSLGAEEVKHLADSLMQDGKPTADSEAVRSALHALVGCAGAAAASQSCGAGAMGAASSVVINHVLDAVQETDASTLNAADKENRKNLVGSLVAGIATAAGQSGAAATANSAAQIEMENNFLVGRQPKQFADRFKACAKAANRASCETQVTKDIAQTQKANGEKLNDCLLRKDTACLDRIKNDIVNAEGYGELAAQGGPDLTQVARDEGARAADIADKCRKGNGLAGCSLLKWGAESVTTLAYGVAGGLKMPVKGGTVTADEGAAATSKPAANGGALREPTSVDAETGLATLERNPRPPANLMADARQNELTTIFTKGAPNAQIELEGTLYSPTAASNPRGTTKVFDTSLLSNAELEDQVFAYAKELAGGKNLSPTRTAGVFAVEADDGTMINVRSKSTSGVARWTVDVINKQRFVQLVGRDKVEIKFQ